VGGGFKHKELKFQKEVLSAAETFGSLNSQKASVSGLAGACCITVTVARETKL